MTTTPATSATQATPAEALFPELSELIIKAINLDLTAEQIDPDAPLYDKGLGLDSIDILEVALEISKRYGFQLRADGEDNNKIFSSLRALAAHIAQHRTK